MEEDGARVPSAISLEVDTTHPSDGNDGTTMESSHSKKSPIKTRRRSSLLNVVKNREAKNLSSPTTTTEATEISVSVMTNETEESVPKETEELVPISNGVVVNETSMEKADGEQQEEKLGTGEFADDSDEEQTVTEEEKKPAVNHRKKSLRNSTYSLAGIKPGALAAIDAAADAYLPPQGSFGVHDDADSEFRSSSSRKFSSDFDTDSPGPSSKTEITLNSSSNPNSQPSTPSPSKRKGLSSKIFGIFKRKTSNDSMIDNAEPVAAGGGMEIREEQAGRTGEDSSDIVENSSDQAGGPQEATAGAMERTRTEEETTSLESKTDVEEIVAATGTEPVTGSGKSGVPVARKGSIMRRKSVQRVLASKNSRSASQSSTVADGTDERIDSTAAAGGESEGETASTPLEQGLDIPPPAPLTSSPSPGRAFTLWESVDSAENSSGPTTSAAPPGRNADVSGADENATQHADVRPAVVTTVSAPDGRRMSIRSMTPGAPPPPPPPPPASALTSAPVTVISAPDGRRLSIRAVTPGAPPAPLPPPPIATALNSAPPSLPPVPLPPAADSSGPRLVKSEASSEPSQEVGAVEKEKEEEEEEVEEREGCDEGDETLLSIKTMQPSFGASTASETDTKSSDSNNASSSNGNGCSGGPPPLPLPSSGRGPPPLPPSSTPKPPSVPAGSAPPPPAKQVGPPPLPPARPPAPAAPAAVESVEDGQSEGEIAEQDDTEEEAEDQAQNALAASLGRRLSFRG